MLKPLSRKELIRKFKVLGYSGPFSGGKHQFMSIVKWKRTSPMGPRIIKLKLCAFHTASGESYFMALKN